MAFITTGTLKINNIAIAGLTNMKDDDKASFPLLYDGETASDYGTTVAGLTKKEGSISADANLKLDVADNGYDASYELIRTAFNTGTLVTINRVYGGVEESCLARIESLSSEFSFTREDVATFSVTFKKFSSWEV